VPVSGWVNYSISVQVWKSRKTRPGVVTEQTWMRTLKFATVMQIRLRRTPDQCGNTSVSERRTPILGTSRAPDPSQSSLKNNFPSLQKILIFCFLYVQLNM